jgi:hypothetical protein
MDADDNDDDGGSNISRIYSSELSDPYQDFALRGLSMNSSFDLALFL